MSKIILAVVAVVMLSGCVVYDRPYHHDHEWHSYHDRDYHDRDWR